LIRFISKVTVIIQRRNAYQNNYVTLLRYKYFNPMEYTVYLTSKTDWYIQCQLDSLRAWKVTLLS